VLNFDLYEYYQNSKDHNIILTFKGALSQEILVEMGDMIKNKLITDKQIKKIFSVFVEMAQNIMHYSGEREYSTKEEKEIGVGILLFTQNTTHYFITSGNVINDLTAERVKSKIDVINQLDSEGLKALYKEQLSKPQEDGSRGAGLGFIDMARKSGNKINYNLNKVDESSSFLTLTISFNKE
jgi:hypothetical protein